MACCFVSYTWLSYRSNLLKKDPIRTAGINRLALDCAEAAHDDIGPEIRGLPEKRQTERLRPFKNSYETLGSPHGEELRYIISGKTIVGFQERFDKGMARWNEKANRIPTSGPHLVVIWKPPADGQILCRDGAEVEDLKIVRRGGWGRSA
ncbi:hypothetical protein GGR54DRAFT_596473 [Hypoxylon sp. NC1633]|nr:hypothetical protein GGR54DRAFT_596473 [Hypoxylon sp. NC1633]